MNTDVYGITSRRIWRGKSLDCLRDEVFQYHSVGLPKSLSKRAPSTTRSPMVQPKIAKSRPVHLTRSIDRRRDRALLYPGGRSRPARTYTP